MSHLRNCREARWPSGRASDSGARGRGVRSSLGSPCCILEQDTFKSQKVLVIPRKRWLRPEKIVDWKVNSHRKQAKTSLRNCGVKLSKEHCRYFTRKKKKNCNKKLLKGVMVGIDQELKLLWIWKKVWVSDGSFGVNQKLKLL